MFEDTCSTCNCILANQKTIYSVKGVLHCTPCANKTFDTLYLSIFGEEIVPSDIGIE